MTEAENLLKVVRDLDKRFTRLFWRVRQIEEWQQKKDAEERARLEALLTVYRVVPKEADA